MNHTRFYIVSLTGNRDDVVMVLMLIAAGSDFVKIVCTCAGRRATVGAAASFGLDGSDIMAHLRNRFGGAGHRFAALTGRSP